MRAVVQRASEGWVRIGGREVARIGPGLVILLGVGENDTESDALYLADKILKLRIFPDDQGKFDFSVSDMRGELLVVSQFTLYGDCRKGRRPSFGHAAGAERAEALYRKFAELLAAGGLRVASGVFQAVMEVGLVNDGPVTILLDSNKEF
jgi:D-tyrosyl-tRNA(Tyr) deacylase